MVEKYLKREVGASIRTHHFQSRKLIDEGTPKPPKIRKEFWEKLVDERGTKEAQAISTTMASIAKNRGQGNSTRKRVEQATALQLSTELGREPYQSEVNEATERELAIITKNSRRRKGKTPIPIGSSTAEIQSIVKLERKMDAFEEFRKFWEPMLQK